MGSNKEKKASEIAVLVSYRLQFYTVVASIASVVLETIFFLLNSGVHVFGSSGFSNLHYLVPIFVANCIFPLVIFSIAFFNTRKYPAPISRWFIADIKTILVLIFFDVLQSTWQWLTIAIYDPSSSKHTGPPPAWITSNASLYITMALALVFMVIVLSKLRKSRK